MQISCGKASFYDFQKNGRSDGPPEHPNTAEDPGTAKQINDKEIEFGSDKVFHIGDDRFPASSCREEIETFNLQGTRYRFEFEVKHADTVIDINIKRLCGVDYGNSNVIHVVKNGYALESDALRRWAAHYQFPGQHYEAGTYQILIESRLNHAYVSGGDHDDFLVGNIYLKADKEIIPGQVIAE